MPTPRKSLETLVRDRSFLARRHADRLLEAPLERSDLVALQVAYRAADGEGARQAIALAFERAIQTDQPDPRQSDVAARLAEIMNMPPKRLHARDSRGRYTRETAHRGR